MSINTGNSLKYDKQALKKQPVVDRLSFQFGKILTSTLLIILVMVSFLIGVSFHLAEVFESWFLAIGMQAVILIASTNSDILPKVKIGGGTLTVIPFVMSFLMTWYLFISFKGLDFPSNSVGFWTALSKAVGLASTEYMFSYLFTFRFNKFMEDLNSLKNLEELEYTETQRKSLESSKKFVDEVSTEKLNDMMKPFDDLTVKQEHLFETPVIASINGEPEITIQPKPFKVENQGLL